MTPGRCKRKLGMGNRRIPDSNIAVSQERDPISKWGKQNARLNGEDTAWGAIAKAGQWLEVSGLGDVNQKISAVIDKILLWFEILHRLTLDESCIFLA